MYLPRSIFREAKRRCLYRTPEPEQPQYASEPAPVVDGITEYTLTAEPEIPAEGVVVTVEAREAKVVDEKSIESSLYDPLKDLNNYQRPPVTLLEDYTSDSQVSDEEIYENKSKIEQTLKDFGIPIQRIKATVGPTVTLYEIVQAQASRSPRYRDWRTISPRASRRSVSASSLRFRARYHRY